MNLLYNCGVFGVKEGGAEVAAECLVVRDVQDLTQVLDGAALALIFTNLVTAAGELEFDNV